MFCDMVGSSALSTRLDPEEQRDVVSAFQGCCATEIKRLGGMVAQYLGDGVLAYFGYPAAHEDDAERAVRAGLSILDAVRTSKSVQGVALQTRIGIATGVVVVGDLVREGVTQENAAIGETTNLSARLQSLADADTLLICPKTHELTGGLFDYRDLGRHDLKGFDRPVHVHQVVSTSKVENRFEARRANVGSPLLGRDEELDLLMRRWEQVRRGEGRVVLLTGEAGIGKSRLTRALQECVRAEPHTPLTYHCSPYHQDSALYPVIGQLTRAVGMERDDTAEARLRKLEALLAQSSANLADEVPLLAALLSIPIGEGYQLPKVAPQRLKEFTLQALIGRLTRLAARQPVLMMFEDLHWVDPTTLELLSLAVDKVKGLRVLMVATARPDFTPPWPSHRHLTTVALTRLDRNEGEALVADVTGGKTLPAEVLEQIMARTDGVPLFIEELTKTVLESGLLREAERGYQLTGPLPPLAIPSTLHASLLARLDRLASVKDVAQIGAVIGREFTYAVIAAVSELPEKNLRAALDQLAAAELIFQRGVPPDATYQFKHALVQDAAYASLVRSRRQALHGRIARALDELFPNIVATEPEIVAHHFTEAGLLEPAVAYWRKAGERFLGRSAYAEAVKHLTQAVEMLSAMPESPETLGTELDIRITMGPALIAVKGVVSTEVEALYGRARELLDRLQTTSRRFPVLWGLWFVNYSRGRYRAANDASEHILDAAQSGEEAGQILQAHHALWSTRSAMGLAADAVVHIEQGIVLYDRELHASQVFLYGNHDAGACCRYHLALNLWLLGYPDRSLTALLDALRLTAELKHPMTRVITLWFAAWVYYQRGDRAAMRESVGELLTLTTEHGISHWPDAACIILKTDASPSKDELVDLHCRLVEGTSNWRRVFCLCVLTELYMEGGHFDDGLAVLSSISEEDREAFYAPEIHRLEGELRRRVPNPDLQESERCFRAALVLAHQRNEKSLELRAGMSLALLWRDQGKSAEAHQLLKPVLDWFTEGLAVRDLTNARKLLDELERPSL
jgi:class 3 adenylate cyclase/tetratricopeptide (TPR) repeat protein